MKGSPISQKLEKFKEKNISQKSLPRGYLKSILNRLSETIDTSNMNALGLSSRLGRIKELNTMSIWKEVVGEYLTTILNLTTISNVSTSATTSSQDSTVLTEQDDKNNEGDADDNYRVITTTLQQIIRTQPGWHRTTIVLWIKY